jgi:hypothetical protein
MNDRGPGPQLLVGDTVEVPEVCMHACFSVELVLFQWGHAMQHAYVIIIILLALG